MKRLLVRTFHPLWLLLAVTLACNAPVPSPLAGGDVQEGYKRVPGDRSVRIEDPTGASLEVPAQAYEERVDLRLAAVSRDQIPRQDALFELVSPLYEVDQAQLADRNRPLRLSIPFQRERLPEGSAPYALTVVWWDGKTWREVPSSVDVAAGTVEAELHHFSIFALAWFRFKEAAYDASGALRGTLYESEFTHDAFTIHYTMQPPAEQTSYWSGQTTVEDDRPPRADEDQSGVPDYVEDLGRYLSNARSTYDGGGPFEGVTIPVASTIHVFVLDLGFDPSQDSGSTGDANPATSHLQVDNKLPDDHLRDAAAHELFHYWQFSELGLRASGKHRWWLEATATWAADEVNDDTNLYVHDIRVNVPNPPRDGFGGIGERSISEHYAASSLAKYLEHEYPGAITATFAGSNALSYPRAWHTSVENLLSAVYGAEFTDVLDEFFASYYYHREFDEDIAAWFQGRSPRQIAEPRIIVDPGTYERHISNLAPYSDRLLTALGGNELERAKLVVRQHATGDDAFVYAFADHGAIDDRKRVRLPGSQGHLGTVVSVPPQELIVGSFGPVGSDAEVNQVHLLATHTTGSTPADLELEIYGLAPPENVDVEDTEADPLVVTWDQAGLPPGQQPEDDGALRAYRLYSIRADLGEQLVIEVEASETQAEIDRADLPGGN